MWRKLLLAGGALAGALALYTVKWRNATLDLVFYDYLKGRDGPSWLPSRRFRAQVSATLPRASARSAVLAVK